MSFTTEDTEADFAEKQEDTEDLFSKYKEFLFVFPQCPPW
jgi:hypothetical protein